MQVKVTLIMRQQSVTPPKTAIRLTGSKWAAIVCVISDGKVIVNVILKLIVEQIMWILVQQGILPVLPVSQVIIS